MPEQGETEETFVLLESERIRLEVKDVSQAAFIRNGIYYRTNHYINESRPYIRDYKLTRYIHLVGLQWVFLAFWLLGFLAILSNVFAFIMAFFHFVWFLVWCQHMYVNIKTMPRVLSQPFFPNVMLGHVNNRFYEITVEKFKAHFAAYGQLGIGLIEEGKGTAQIQVFSYTARRFMWSCIVVSTAAFLASGFMILYCLAFGIYASVL